MSLRGEFAKSSGMEDRTGEWEEGPGGGHRVLGPGTWVGRQGRELGWAAKGRRWSQDWLPSGIRQPEVKEGKTQVNTQNSLERSGEHLSYLPGMILSGPFLEVISVNSLRILAAFFASDFKLEGIGLFTKTLKKDFNAKNLLSRG